MKIRTGFVSNSSTTSFSLYGFSMSEETLNKNHIKNYLELEKKLAEPNLDMEYFVHPYQDNIYVGRPWRTIRDNETGKEFKETTKEALKKFFPNLPDENYGVIEDGWYDG